MLKPSPYQLLSFKLLPVAAISALGLSFAAQLPGVRQHLGREK
jgi:hypothetical protein